MSPKQLALDELANQLDALFGIHDWPPDPAMSHWMPEVYRRIGVDPAEILEPGFCACHNGLMLRSSSSIGKVYCAVFPALEILESVMAAAQGDALLFLHHPIDLESSGRGFLAIPLDTLERLRQQGISIYACHAPLDCHGTMGTTASMAQAFDVHVERAFHSYGRGHAGRLGHVAPTSVPELIRRGQMLFGVEEVDIGGGEPQRVTRVALVAGGGDDPALLAEAESLGAEAYITGDWYTRSCPSHEGDRKWVQANREACRDYAAKSSMALLGFSHAASEFLVMTLHMAAFFTNLGLAAQCLKQSDWRR